MSGAVVGARRLLARHWPIVVLGAMAMAVAVWAHEAIFSAYSWNRDEPVYLWHVEVLRSGSFTAPDGGAPRLFHPWLTGAEDGVFFSQYTLGWPLVLLAADLLTGTPAAALPFAALLLVVGTYALAIQLTGDRRLATVAAAVMVASPILAIQGGVFLGYVFTSGVGLLFLVTLIAGVRDGRRALVVVAGLLLGWVFLTRPFDAVLWGLAGVVYAVVSEWRRKDRLVRMAPWLALGAGPLVVAGLAYNAHITGAPLQFPITAADPLDTFGFGRRRLMPGLDPVRYGPRLAVESTLKNLAVLPMFLAGSYVAVAVAAAGLWVRRRDPRMVAVLALGAVFPLGYFFFFGMHISSLASRISGPIYFVPLYAPLAILMGSAVIAAWRRRAALAVGVCAALVLATIPFAVDRLELNRRISESQQPWRAARPPAGERSLVVVSKSGPYLMHLNPFSANDPALEGDVLYATDLGPRTLDVMDDLDGRTPYLQRASLPPDAMLPGESPDAPEVTLRPMEVVTGEAVRVTVRVSGAGPDTGAFLGLGEGLDAEWRPLEPAAGGVSEAVWVLPADDPRLAPRLGTVRVGVGRVDAGGATGRPALSHTFHYRRTDGEVEVLLPTTQSRAEMEDGELTWEEAGDLPGLEVRVVDGSATTPP